MGLATQRCVLACVLGLLELLCVYVCNQRCVRPCLL